MNEALPVLRRMFRFDDQQGDVFGTDAAGQGAAFADWFHPEVCHSLFGPTGTKELLVGREAFLDFVHRCAAALADRRDEILAITPVDRQCAFVHARAFRKSRASGEELTYEWAMLYRVEQGLITYGADMLDVDAQAFWQRIGNSSRH